MNPFRATFFIFILLIIIVLPEITGAQNTPDEHSEHHPQPQMSPIPTATPTKSNNSNRTMRGGMSEMMNEMMQPPPKEIYPSLIQLPQDLPPEKRDEIKRLADERVNEGNLLISSGFAKLAGANQKQDVAAIRDATEEIRRGQTLLESGLDVQQALAENKTPQDTAFKWFKGEMNLAPAMEVENPHGFFGLSWFHYISMLTLAVFSAVIIWMYFHKMKRADALIKRLAGGQVFADGERKELLLSADNTTLDNSGTLVVNSQIAPTQSNTWTGTLRVARIFQETPLVKTFRLVEPGDGKLPFNYLPGQFITVTIAPEGLTIKRSYTIASSPTQRDMCEITVKREEHGTVSAYLHDHVHEGELLQFTGPSGKFTFTGKESDSIVLIAGGVGVTPMMSVVRYLTDHSWHGEIYFIFGCDSEPNIIFREEMEYLQKRHPNLHITIIIEKPSADSENSNLIGRISKEVLTKSIPEIASRRIHICGPPPMMEAVKIILSELEVPAENIKTEIFGGKLPQSNSSTAALDEFAPTAVATFVRSNKTAMLTANKTILEASEEVGVNIDFSCRVGTCGICKTKLLSGEVKMEVEDALTKEDKASSIILACQAKATEDVVLDA